MSDNVRPPIDQSITFTYADDLGAASEFFKDVLELDLVVDQGVCHIYRLTDTSFVGVCAISGRPSTADAVTLTIVSSSVDEWYDFLVSKGVECVKNPGHSDEFNIYNSLFVSPTGCQVEIQSFDDTAWNTRTI